MNKTKNKTAYRLYANSVEDETLKKAQKLRFNRITPGYLLVYTTKEIKDWPEITDENVNILTGADRQWLFECNMELITEEMARKSGSFGVDMHKAIAELENALIREKEKISEQQ